MSKKVIIIGAGVSGMAAGIYAGRAGFDVTIYERHIIPGGLSTSWSRKGYLFEGGMHWLTGSSEKLALNKIWHETGALKENNPVVYKDPFYTVINGHSDKPLHMFRNLDNLRQHFLEYAPEDKKAIERLIKDARLFLPVHLVVNDIPGLKTDNPVHPKIGELLKMGKAVMRLGKLIRMSYIDYVNQFSNKDIRHLLMTLIGDRYNALSMIYTIASFASGDCGYPEGGSLRLSRNMADTFEELGGKIEYRSTVEKVVIENKKTKGVVVNGNFVEADAVIVSQDARKAIDKLFDVPLGRWTKTMRKVTVSEQNMFVCLGVKADLSKYPRGIVIGLEKPFKAGGLDFNELRVNNYANYEKHAPDGCTAVTCLFLGDSYDFWKAAKADGSYKEKKAELAQRLIDELSNYVPEINKDSVEITDVATPMTYERYCDTYMGGWMSVWLPGGKAVNFCPKEKSVEGLYFAGQRVMAPGGLPCAVYSGRMAAQYLCRDNKVKFI